MIRMRFLFAIAATALIAACGGNDGGSGSGVTAAAETQSKPEYIQLKGENVYVMIVPAGVDPATLKAHAKERCGEVEFCKVFGWADRASAARALPMTDAELESQILSYGVNRASGFETFLIDCDRLPRTDGIECL